MAVESPQLVPSFDGITWITPKTNWAITDKFNKEDYNRIKNNLDYLQHILKELDHTYQVKDLGEDINDYVSKFKAKSFNDFEIILEDCNIYGYDNGITKEFEPNGAFIDYVELNRIESGCIRLHDIMCNQYMGRRTLPAMLGVSLMDNFFNI